MSKLRSERNDDQGSEITAGRGSLLHMGHGLPYGELDGLSIRLTKSLRELEPVATSMSPLCYDKTTWSVVAMFAVVKNSSLLTVVFVKRWKKKATNEMDQKSLQQTRLPVTLDQLLARPLTIEPGSIDVGDGALCRVVPRVRAAQHPRLQELARSLRTEIGWYQESMLLYLLSMGISNSGFHIWKPPKSTSITEPSSVPRARFCLAIAAARKLPSCTSDTVYNPVIKRDAQIRIPGLIMDRHVLGPEVQGSLLLPDTAVERNVTTFTYPGSPVILTVKHNAVVMEVRPTDRMCRHKFFANTFATLDTWGLQADGITTSAAGIAVSLHSEVPLVGGEMDEDYEITNSNLHGAVEDLRCHSTVDFVVNMAIVSVIDGHPSKESVLAGDIFSTFGDNNIKTTMISHGKQCC
jgi:hypothetical protein